MNEEARLDALDELLSTFASVDEGLLISDFDGFCAGLIVCPEMIPPSEWLPVVWGKSQPPEFENDQDMQAALDLIMAHYNDVARALAPPNFELAPVYDHDTRTDETLWEGWAFGFEQAMRLRANTWERIVESGDEEAASSVLMMLELYNIADGKSELTDAQIDELTDKAPNLIPELVFAINRWTKADTKPAPFPSIDAANTPHAPAAGRKVGRNEACPCGSGLKYKRCCGGN
ncbi:UPF0149 family protein [Sulfitobacter geojensis]|nr:UPF0149 family protein [Sulfitobacter geojensis]